MKESIWENTSNINNKNISKVEKSFDEIQIGDTTRFICKIDEKEVGVISATLIENNIYNIGGLFVDPSKRSQGIASGLVKLVNVFLEKNKALGKLSNTIHGEAVQVYENNNWVKGSYKSQGAYGAYEYTYDCRKK